MKIFVFDTETTWFINKKENNLNKQPHIIQFAWIMWDITDWIFTEEKRINLLINPWISIPYASSQISHIYNIDVQDKKRIEEHIDEILYYINTPDIIVWHNIEFDEEMIKLELRRLWKEYEYTPKQVICTMKNSVDFCSIKWNWERFKYPKLWELYKKIFWEYFLWAHDAMVDVESTLKCFLELNKLWIIEIKEKNETVLSLF